MFTYLYRFHVAEGWPQTHYVAEDDLELLILLPVPPGAGIAGIYLPHLAYEVLGEGVALCVLGEHPVL